MKHCKIIFLLILLNQVIFVQSIFSQDRIQLISTIAVSEKYIEAERAAPLALQQKLSSFRAEGVQKKWTFQVVATEVANMNLKDITGATAPDAQAQASGISQNNQPPPLGNNIADANARSFDLRALRFVSPVRRQFNCGSCWAMASIASLETAHILKNKISSFAINLSEEQVLNCSGVGTCSGGNCPLALEYLKNNNIAEEADYPYTAMNAACRTTPLSPIKAYNWGWVGNTNPKTPSVAEIKNAIVKFGGIASYIWVNHTFQLYGSGVFNDQTVISDNSRNPSDTTEGGHCIQIIGWNDDLNAWLIKNSWGNRWGMDGFGWIDYNVCDIGFWATWVVANDVVPVYKTTPLPKTGNRTVKGYFDWSYFSAAYPIGMQPNEVFAFSVLAPQSKSGNYIGSFPVSGESFGPKAALNPEVIMENPIEQASKNAMMKSTTLRVNFTIMNLPENIPLTIIPDITGKFMPGITAVRNKPVDQKETDFRVYIDGDFTTPVSNEVNTLAFSLKHSFADMQRLSDKAKLTPLQTDMKIKTATDPVNNSNTIKNNQVAVPVKNNIRIKQ
jgi:C1A family cysteine protease